VAEIKGMLWKKSRVEWLRRKECCERKTVEEKEMGWN
jgi:hypothetical protein